MKKIESIHRGRMWLNIFCTDDGQVLLTINKSCRDREGRWKETPFLKSDSKDIDDLMELLSEFRKGAKALSARARLAARGAVQYIKGKGFHLERDEVLGMGIQEILKLYGFDPNRMEPRCRGLILDALLPLAEANEIREGLVKDRELRPVDSGYELVRQDADEGWESASSYSVFYSYPVEGALKDIPRQGGARCVM